MPFSLAISTAPLLMPGHPCEASQAQYSTGNLSCNTTPFRKKIFLFEFGDEFLVMNFWWWISAGRNGSLAQFSSSNHSTLIPSMVMLRIKTPRRKLCLQLLTQGCVWTLPHPYSADGPGWRGLAPDLGQRWARTEGSAAALGVTLGLGGCFIPTAKVSLTFKRPPKPKPQLVSSLLVAHKVEAYNS